jgi:hypothetical protein
VAPWLPHAAIYSDHHFLRCHPPSPFSSINPLPLQVCKGMLDSGASFHTGVEQLFGPPWFTVPGKWHNCRVVLGNGAQLGIESIQSNELFFMLVHPPQTKRYHGFTICSSGSPQFGLGRVQGTILTHEALKKRDPNMVDKAMFHDMFASWSGLRVLQVDGYRAVRA